MEENFCDLKSVKEEMFHFFPLLVCFFSWGRGHLLWFLHTMAQWTSPAAAVLPWLTLLNNSTVLTSAHAAALSFHSSSARSQKTPASFLQEGILSDVGSVQ